jgi:perosamine synthetase
MRQVGLGTADIGAEERGYVQQILDTGRLSPGPFVRRFESEFAAAHGCRFGIMLNSGTSALQVALATLKEAHGWHDGDEVLVPALTFIASSNVVLQNGLAVRFVDVDAATYNLDPAGLDDAVSPHTRAVMPVHLFGLPCDMAPIQEVARRRGLDVVEDSCETMFMRYRGQPVGSFGAFGCFSTYMAHILTTGVGGLALTQDPELERIFRSVQNHGRNPVYITIDDDDAARDDAALLALIRSRYEFVRMGYSYRTTELEAALGLGQLHRSTAILARRRENAAHLIAALRPLEDRLQLPTVPADREHAFMMFPLVCRVAGDRDRLCVHLERRGIETRFFMPVLGQPVYKVLLPDFRAEDFAVAARLTASGLYVGCHQHVTREDLDWIVECVHEFFRQ